MTDILGTVTTVVSTVKKLGEITKKIQDAETNNTIADLSLGIAELKLQIVDLLEENRELKVQLAAAHEIFDVREKLEVRKNLYYFKAEVTDRPEGPYCPSCLDSKGKLVLMSDNPMRRHGRYLCSACHAMY